MSRKENQQHERNREAARLAGLIADGYFDDREDEFRRDPVKELAECASKRLLVEVSLSTVRTHGLCDRCVTCLTVRMLALPYSDRPGYLEEWRPA